MEKICRECGNEKVWCPKCEKYHHKASFSIEHEDDLSRVKKAKKLGANWWMIVFKPRNWREELTGGIRVRVIADGKAQAIEKAIKERRGD